MLGQKDKHKFHFLHPQNDMKTTTAAPGESEGDKAENKKFLNIDDSIIKKPDEGDDSGDDEEEEEDAESLKNMLNVEAEDIH